LTEKSIIFAENIECMSRKNFFFTILLCFLCHYGVAQNINIETGYYTIDDRYDTLPHNAIDTIINKYKPEVDQKVAKKIGESELEMSAYMPESLLSNFSTDVLLKKGADFLGEKVDLSILNIGGIRATMPKGDVTLGNIFEIYPFDNIVDILYIKGSYLKELFDFFAKKGMQPIGNARLKVRDKKIEEVLIGGELLDETKIYKVATLNYLRTGGDGMGILNNAEKVINTRRQFRDMIQDYISDKYNLGEKINSTLDNRVIIY
jgi:2',3'-cyclic-nucleotide 2'-phosphodiesterase (5'-nucleotidase family)